MHMTSTDSARPERVGKVAADAALAVFDLDGTLVDRDTLVPFLVTYSVKHFRLWALLTLLPTILIYCLRLQSARAAKQVLLRSCFRGQSRERVRTHASWFANVWISKHLRQDVVMKLRNHQREAHRVILLSASPDLYLTEIAQFLGIDEVVCTRTTVVNGVCAGTICGNNCKGEDKLLALKQYLGMENSPSGSVAYGDSSSDRYVLGWVQRGIYV
jgi:phosphatidylglycerophosphatase C